MTTSQSQTVTVVDMEAGHLPLPDSSSPPQQSTVSHRSGRTYRWPVGLTTSGILTNGASLTASAIGLKYGNTPLYIAIAFSIASSVVHVIEGIVSCVLQPRKALEENVAAVGKAGDDVEKQLTALQHEVQSLQSVNTDRERQLKAEQEETKAARAAVDQQIAEVGRLTLQLQDIQKGLQEARLVADRWEHATQELTRQIAAFQATKIDENVEALTAQVKQLSLTKQSFSTGVDRLEESTDEMHQTETTWGKMVDQLQQSFQGITMVAVEKRKLLEDADARIRSLTQRVEELQGIDQRLQEVMPKYEQLTRDLDEANRQLTELTPLLKSAAFQAFLADFMAHKK